MEAVKQKGLTIKHRNWTGNSFSACVLLIEACIGYSSVTQSWVVVWASGKGVMSHVGGPGSTPSADYRI